MEQSHNIVIFGANPVEKTNREGDIEVRLSVLKNLLQNITGNTINSIYTIGGEKFAHPQKGLETTEAEYIAELMSEMIPETNQYEIKPVTDGQETITQMDAFIKHIKAEGKEFDNFKMISSWHQLPRAALMLYEATGKMPELNMTFNTPSVREGLYDMFSCSAGLGYAALVIAMRKLGKWEDGGPLITKITEERNSKQGYSWFNAV